MQVGASVSAPISSQEHGQKEQWTLAERRQEGHSEEEGDDTQGYSEHLQGEGTSCVAHLPAPMEVARARPDVVAAAVLVDHLSTAVRLRVRRVRELKPARESSET